MKFIRENKDNKVQFIEQKKFIEKYGSNNDRLKEINTSFRENQYQIPKLEKINTKEPTLSVTTNRDSSRNEMSPIIKQKRQSTVLKQLLQQQNQQVLEAKSSRNFKLKNISIDYNYSVQLPSIEEYFKSQDKLQLLTTIKQEKSRVEVHIDKLEKLKREFDVQDYVLNNQNKQITHHSNTPSKYARRKTMKLNTSGSSLFGKTENVRKAHHESDKQETSLKKILQKKELEQYSRYERVKCSKALPQLVQQINETQDEKSKLSDKFNKQLYYCIHNRDYSLKDKIREYRSHSLNYSQFYSIQKRLKQHLEGRFKATDSQVHHFEDELKQLAKTNRLTESRKQELYRIKQQLEKGNYLENF